MDQKNIDEVRHLVEELKNNTAQFGKQQESILATYSKIIAALNQTQEGYGESLKTFIQRLQSDSKPIQTANISLHDLLNTAALFGGKATQASRQIDSLSQLIATTESNLTTWSAETKAEIKNIHQQAEKNIFRKMKLFILINSAGTIGIFALIFYFFYKTGLFN
ncbi:MAG: hypothetical protein WA081_17795 [Desulfosalsimonadaceae bacterium]